MYAEQLELHIATEYVSYNPAHYYDCTCDACYAAHYPCDNLDCDYCDSVRALKYIAVCNWRTYDDKGIFDIEYTGKIIAYQCGQIIDYATYVNKQYDMRAYDKSDMIWRKCNGCSRLIDGLTSDDNHGYCSAECKHDNREFYCIKCEDTVVEYHGDVCENCANNDDSDDSDTDDSGYNLGEIVDQSDYSSIENCWIDRDGKIRYVAYCNHQRTAERMGFSGVTACENAGYIHVSVYWDYRDRWHYIPNKPTSAQIETIRLYCEANPVVKLPKCAKYDPILDEPKGIQPMQNLSPAWLRLTRVERDRFYPLSGD